jgi:signal transduction histidine kinase
VRIVREFAPDTPRVELDEDLSEQVFTNLILNACEAMGDQGGELKIRIFGESTEHEELAIAEIVDSGPGVPAAMREQIFNPFVSTKKTGVGLGLAIVSKIVDAHGGRVTLGASETGQQGACFRVTFPAAGVENRT